MFLNPSLHQINSNDTWSSQWGSIVNWIQCEGAEDEIMQDYEKNCPHRMRQFYLLHTADD